MDSWVPVATQHTTSIGTLLTREKRTRLAAVGVETELEGGATAVTAPRVAPILKFVKHGLASTATARPAKHPALCRPCAAPVTAN